MRINHHENIMNRKNDNMLSNEEYHKKYSPNWNEEKQEWFLRDGECWQDIFLQEARIANNRDNRIQQGSTMMYNRESGF